jgi:hypothetical protein
MITEGRSPEVIVGSVTPLNPSTTQNYSSATGS